MLSPKDLELILTFPTYLPSWLVNQTSSKIFWSSETDHNPNHVPGEGKIREIRDGNSPSPEPVECHSTLSSGEDVQGTSG